MNLLTTTRNGLCVLVMALLGACGGDSADVIINNPPPDGGGGPTDPGSSGFDASALIDAIGSEVIVGTYQGMANATENLLSAVTVLTDGNLSTANLQVAQQRWYEVRKYWESSEGFLWGPVDTQGYDPQLDDWPVNKVDLDNILADDSIDLGNQTVIDQLETTVKGFHTIEYLLFNDGTGSEDTYGCGAAEPGTQACYDNILAALGNDPRRAQYLLAISINVDKVSDLLLNDWVPSGGDYLDEVLNAGKGSAPYPSQRALLEEIINGTIGIADEVAAGKLNGPFSEGDPLTVESKFSGNSLTDFQYNIRSIRNVYCGVESVGTESTVNACGSAGASGLAELVRDFNPDLDAEVQAAIDSAIGAIANIPAPYYDAVVAAQSDPAVAQQIQGAIDAVLAVMEILQSRVLPILDEVDFAY